MITEDDLYERIKTLEYEKIELQNKIDEINKFNNEVVNSNETYTSEEVAFKNLSIINGGKNE